MHLPVITSLIRLTVLLQRQLRHKSSFIPTPALCTSYYMQKPDASFELQTGAPPLKERVGPSPFQNPSLHFCILYFSAAARTSEWRPAGRRYVTCTELSDSPDNDPMCRLSLSGSQFSPLFDFMQFSEPVSSNELDRKKIILSHAHHVEKEGDLSGIRCHISFKLKGSLPY